MKHLRAINKKAQRIDEAAALEELGKEEGVGG